ncbi:MAG: hypothetical protein Q8J70_09780 [Thiobacillus sp.]|nr:hypothetical protein [Thiobacillus sp.]
MQLARTVKGQEEIFNLGHTLRPRHRQLLFCIGDGISFGELCSKHPKCVELESMVNELLQNGFIQTLRNMAPAPAARVASAPAAAPIAAPVQATGSLSEAQTFVLEFMATLVGTKSPVYKQMSEVKDIAGFKALLPMCRKVIAAVASPHQAAEMEAGATQRLGG